MIFTTLFLTFATLAHALLLKVFVRDDECEPGARNTLKRALTISAGTLLAGWLLTLVPWVGWPMAFLGWFIVMDDVYRLSRKRTWLLFALQVGVGIAIAVVLFFLLLSVGLI